MPFHHKPTCPNKDAALHVGDPAYHAKPNVPGYWRRDPASGRLVHMAGITARIRHHVPGVSQRPKARRARQTTQPRAAPRGARSTMRLGRQIDREITAYVRDGCGALRSSMSAWTQRFLERLKMSDLHLVATQVVVGSESMNAATEIDFVVEMHHGWPAPRDNDPDTPCCMRGIGELKTGYDAASLDKPGRGKGLVAAPPPPRRKKGDPPAVPPPRMPNTVAFGHFLQPAIAAEMYRERLGDDAPPVMPLVVYASLCGKAPRMGARETLALARSNQSLASTRNLTRTVEEGRGGDGTVLQMRVEPPPEWAALTDEQRRYVVYSAMAAPKEKGKKGKK